MTTLPSVHKIALSPTTPLPQTRLETRQVGGNSFPSTTNHAAVEVERCGGAYECLMPPMGAPLTAVQSMELSSSSSTTPTRQTLSPRTM